MKNEIREYTEWDAVSHLQLRPIDVLEINASWGCKVNPTLALYECIKCSDMVRCVYNGCNLVAVFGFAEYEDDMCNPWLLASEDFSFSRDDLKVAKAYVNAFSRKYSKLFNRIHKSNKQSIKFLTYLGFTIDIDNPDDEGMVDFYK